MLDCDDVLEYSKVAVHVCDSAAAECSRAVLQEEEEGRGQKNPLPQSSVVQKKRGKRPRSINSEVAR